MSVTNCPATSSMTTNCGSFRPEARATSVAAGIPMRVTAAAATMVAEVRLATDICELANAHTITVANDPHVPGPGLRRPAPKKVATSVAQSGGRDAPATAGGTPALRWHGAAPGVVAPPSSAAVVRVSRPHTGSDGSPVAVLGSAFTTRLLYRCGLRLYLRHRQPETKLHTRRSPTCRDRSGGSARCKKGSPRPPTSPASCRSDNGA